MEFYLYDLNYIIIYFYKYALNTAVEKENIDLIKLLLTNEKLNINELNIFFNIFTEF